MTKRSLQADSIKEFLCLADQFDALAATAHTEAVKKRLERLAARFRVFAAQHANAGRVRLAFVEFDSEDE